MLLRAPGATEIGAVISLHGQREHAVITPSGTPHLRLQFDDAAAESDDPIEAARLRMRRRAAAEIGLRLEPPRREHAESILNFAREHSALRGALLCQCLAGVSRSSAAALLCLASWTEPGDEPACVAYLYRVRACAQPHRDLIVWGDSILERKGRLLHALEVAR